MLALKKVAITGGLSSGKSTVGRLFKDLGAYLLDSDEIVHKLLKNTSIKEKIITLLGPEVEQNKSLNRKKIASLVFSDPQKLNRLEQIIHPHVREEIEKKYKQELNSKKWNLFVVEIPLLFETKMEKNFDATIAVVADPDVCMKRFSERFNKDEFELRSQRQWPIDQKAQKADFLIYNNGDLSELKLSCQKIHSKLIQ